MSNKETTVSQYVQFAGQIAELVDKEQYDFTTVLNGLAIASASFLVDYVVDLDGNVRTSDIDEASARFVQVMQEGIKFATEQVKQIVADRKVD